MKDAHGVPQQWVERLAWATDVTVDDNAKMGARRWFECAFDAHANGEEKLCIFQL